MQISEMTECVSEMSILLQRRKGRSKTPPLRPTASTKNPGTPVFENQAARSSERQRAAALQSRGAGGGGGSRGGGTLAEGLMFSHKPNPIFDTNDTNSSRGSDYEVINLTGMKNGSGSSPEQTPVRLSFYTNAWYPILNIASHLSKQVCNDNLSQLILGGLSGLYVCSILLCFSLWRLSSKCLSNPNG